MKVFVTFLLLVAVLHLTKSQSCSNEKVVIICSSINNYDWGSIGIQLTCYADSSTNSTFPYSSVSSVVHSNRSDVTNLAQITGLEIVSATVKFIPFGIGKHFPNLKALLINNCGLLSVNKENLKQFRNSLEVLSLHDNKLISIDADLFEFNPNLKGISLYNNPIRHIEPEFFTNLKNLKNIEWIELNPANCINQYFHTASGHNIETSEWNNEKCNDISAKIETENLIRNDFRCLYEKIDDSTSEIIDNIQKSTSISTQNSESTNKSIMELESRLEALTSAQDRKTKTLIEKTNANIDRHGALLVTLGNKSSKDFNNLTTLIQGNKDFIATKLAENRKESDDQISEIKGEIDMLKKLTLALTDAINQQNIRVGDLMEYLERKH